MVDTFLFFTMILLHSEWRSECHHSLQSNPAGALRAENAREPMLNMMGVLWMTESFCWWILPAIGFTGFWRIP
jgi:hypothetical protein